MKKYIKTVLILSFMFSSGLVLAFPADPDTTVDPPAPIDSYVIGFLIIGLGFAYWKQTKKTRKV